MAIAERKLGSDAFRIEYSKNIPEQVLFNDVVSYLGEYRFNLQKYSYDLVFKDGKLRDPHRGDTMESVAQRAVERKFWQGKSSRREKAETQGFINLDNQINLARDGDTVIWASPPGKKEDGYGDYGFIFVGKIENQNFDGRKIKMTAIRIENPNLNQFNKAWGLITGEKKEHQTPEEFLENPKVLKENLTEEFFDNILFESFTYIPKQNEKEKFFEIIQRMNPLIKDFINLVKFGLDHEKIKALNTLENYFLKLKKDYEFKNIIFQEIKNDLKIRDIVGDYGHKPPVVRGSCGSSSSNSSNLFSKGSSLENFLDGEEWFVCPKCHYKADGPVGNQCPGCGLTKNEYAEETGITCD